jgi:hypothetical protein
VTQQEDKEIKRVAKLFHLSKSKVRRFWETIKKDGAPLEDLVKLLYHFQTIDDRVDDEMMHNLSEEEHRACLAFSIMIYARPIIEEVAKKTGCSIDEAEEAVLDHYEKHYNKIDRRTRQLTEEGFTREQVTKIILEEQ